jgi:hypothetical protein
MAGATSFPMKRLQIKIGRRLAGPRFHVVGGPIIFEV